MQEIANFQGRPRNWRSWRQIPDLMESDVRDSDYQLSDRQKAFLQQCKFKKNDKSRSNKEATNSNDDICCTQSNCILSGEEERTIKCVECSRSLHWKCTGLPAYRIQQCVTRTTETFVCINCTEIDNNVRTEMMTSVSEDALKMVIAEQADRISKLEEQLEKLNSEEVAQDNQTKKRKRLESSQESEMIDAMIADSANKDIEIAELKESLADRERIIEKIRNEKQATSKGSSEKHVKFPTPREDTNKMLRDLKSSLQTIE